MRPNTMTVLRPVMCAVLLALGLTGCGTGTDSTSPETSGATDARLFGSCRADDPALDHGSVMAEADVDGSGTRNEIAYLPPDVKGPCANALYTTFDGKPSAVSLGDASLDPRSAEVVQLKGTDRQLVVAREQSHPRGGYLVHVYGGAGGRLAEVLADGEPVLGFVATDGGTAPATTRCTDDGGIEKLSASTHEPPGVILAWDVQRTTYALDGNAAKKRSSRQVKEAAADPVLRKQMPQLFRPEGYFADCIVHG